MPHILYFIRHGIAADRSLYAQDSDRPLSEAGNQKTENIAQRLVSLGVTVDRILTSPLLRARQTAEILKAAGMSDRLEVLPFLSPGGRIQDALVWLEHCPAQSLALVGHEPDLGEWVESLVWGEPRQGLVVKKASIMGIQLPDGGDPIGQSQLFWLAPPRFLL
ncbi:MAG: phosphohistidine phosphatase SixA [Synechococcales cyanobacterium K44_A2020_017]|jgi:phosphohistidine phosphatase|nr:phosphohistidine phosphatase SixA [Synechococcales cyanobacterium K32_A2020_035]MBF2093756.1 phosphohistidine phosphatase SixA [Synechococcales cyanobacterium K44_A2020_017]